METSPCILIIRFRSIGDVVFTLPAVNALRDHFPTSEIFFLTSKECSALVETFPAVDKVIALDRDALRSGNPLKMVTEFVRLMHRLLAVRFDLVVDLQGYGETALLAWLTHAPRRWGSVYSKGRAWAYTLGVPREASQHHAFRSLEILRAGNVPISTPRNQLALPATTLKAAEKFFRNNNLDLTRRTLFIQPFTSSPHKNWPLENYLSLADYWEQRNWQVIFGGGPADRTTLESVLADRFITSAGVPLLLTSGIMQLSTLIVGGDTGALHLAVACGKRVVMIMESTAPGTAFPFEHPDWATTPRQGTNLSALSVEDVTTACERAFSELADNASG